MSSLESLLSSSSDSARQQFSTKKKKKTQQGNNSNTEHPEQLCDGKIGDWLGLDWRLKDRQQQKRDREIRTSAFNVSRWHHPWPQATSRYFSSLSLSLSLNTYSLNCVIKYKYILFLIYFRNPETPWNGTSK